MDGRHSLTSWACLHVIFPVLTRSAVCAGGYCDVAHIVCCTYARSDPLYVVFLMSTDTNDSHESSNKGGFVRDVTSTKPKCDG